MTNSANNIVRLKQWMVERLQGFVDPQTIPDRTPETMEVLSQRFVELCRHSQLQLPDEQARQIFAEVASEIVGYGPMDPFLTDDEVTEVLDNINNNYVDGLENEGFLACGPGYEDENEIIAVPIISAP